MSEQLKLEFDFDNQGVNSTPGFGLLLDTDESAGITVHGMDEAAEAKGRRIVACVNACAGLADPAWEIEAMRAELARLREIVGGLPVTADGVPVTPGMTVWLWWDRDHAPSMWNTDAELERLRALESALPQCWTLIDGKLSRTRAVVPGMDIYEVRTCGTDKLWLGVASLSEARGIVADNGYSTFTHPVDCADSPEAAEALRKQRVESRGV